MYRWQPKSGVVSGPEHGRGEEISVGVPGRELVVGESGAPAAAARARARARPLRAQPLRRPRRAPRAPRAPRPPRAAAAPRADVRSTAAGQLHISLNTVTLPISYIPLF